MAPATLSATARRDLAVVTNWISRGSRKAAIQFQVRLKAALIRLGEDPHTGVVRPDLAHEVYRFAGVSGFPHILIYNSQRKPPVVMRILHGSQDLSKILSMLPSPQGSMSA